MLPELYYCPSFAVRSEQIRPFNLRKRMRHCCTTTTILRMHTTIRIYRYDEREWGLARLHAANIHAPASIDEEAARVPIVFDSNHTFRRSVLRTKL